MLCRHMREATAEVTSIQGERLARGVVSERPEGGLEFRPLRAPTLLVRYFFLAGRHEACLKMGSDDPVQVRLETRWRDGMRRWNLLPQS